MSQDKWAHEWISEKHSLADLQKKAFDFDEMNQGHDASALSFLQFAKVMPEGMGWSRRNKIPRTSLNADALPAPYLCEVAKEWDDDGHTTATEFIDALSFEIVGTRQNTIVNETMEDLGRL